MLEVEGGERRVKVEVEKNFQLDESSFPPTSGHPTP